MINATELRIGNYVFLKSKKKNWEILEGYEIDLGCDSDDFDPIPLTEEILLKCGFEYVEEVFSYCYKFHNIYISTIGEFIFAPFCTNDSDCLVKIKYLHQLQNLYFALTGQELEINL